MTSKWLREVVAATLCAVCLAGTLRAAPPISYAGGDGSTEEKAVVIKGGNEETGVAAEYAYLEKHHPGYQRGAQAAFSKGKRQYDRLSFTTAKGEQRTIFFDITDFFGKLD